MILKILRFFRPKRNNKKCCFWQPFLTAILTTVFGGRFWRLFWTEIFDGRFWRPFLTALFDGRFLRPFLMAVFDGCFDGRFDGHFWRPFFTAGFDGIFFIVSYDHFRFVSVVGGGGEGGYYVAFVCDSFSMVAKSRQQKLPYKQFSKAAVKKDCHKWLSKTPVRNNGKNSF